MVQASLFTKIDFYHVLWENNPHADLEANKGASLSPGELILNANGSFCPPHRTEGLTWATPLVPLWALPPRSSACWRAAVTPGVQCSHGHSRSGIIIPHAGPFTCRGIKHSWSNAQSSVPRLMETGQVTAGSSMRGHVGLLEIMNLGLSHEVNPTAVLSKEDARSGFMGEFIHAYDTLVNSGMKVMSNHLGICWIHGTLGYEVTPDTASTKVIRNRNAKGWGILTVLIDWELCRQIAWRLLVYRMEVDSSSVSALVPSSVDKTFKEVKQELISLQSQVNAMDYEGGQRLDHVSKDLVFLRKKIKRKVRPTKHSFSRQLVELELKVDKLALKFLKHEENGMSSSSEGWFSTSCLGSPSCSSLAPRSHACFCFCL